MSEPSILVIEDETESRTLLKLLLETEGYCVIQAEDGVKGLQCVHEFQPQLIILDRVIPRIDGLSLCECIRQFSNVPILMLSNLRLSNDKVAGLNAGANDYMSKPFDPPELLARIRVLLRTVPLPTAAVLSFGDELTLNLATQSVWRQKELLSLSPREFMLLAFFMRHPQQVLTKAQ